MKWLTKRARIEGILEAWEGQFGSSPEKPSWRRVHDHLKQWDLSQVSEEDIIDLIGNESWTRLRCSECNSDVETALQVGSESDATRPCAFICPTCLRLIRDELNVDDEAEFATARRQ